MSSLSIVAGLQPARLPNSREALHEFWAGPVKKQRIGVFPEAGIDREVAENAFEVYYGNQEINIFTDPIGEAKALCGVDVSKNTC